MQMSDQVSRETTGLPKLEMQYRWVTERGLRLLTGASTLPVYMALRDMGLPEVEELIPADGSLLVVLLPGSDISAALADMLNNVDGTIALGAGRAYRIPVIFDGEDLPVAAWQARMTTEMLIECVLNLELTVGFLGFQPGFAYLVGLPAELCLPRRASPRKRVAAGSVALGGGYCGIYPAPGPGGWHLIGRTDLRLFDPQANPPARFQPGDVVKFVAA